MKTWYTYRIRRSLAPVTGNVSFHFCEDRKSFDSPSTVRGVVFYWRDIAPIVFEQVMVEAELTRKYKA